MSQFNVGVLYTRNHNGQRVRRGVFMDTTPGSRYEITDISGTFITFVDDVGDIITVDHVQFNQHFNSHSIPSPQPVVDESPVSRAEFNQLLAIATKLAEQVDTLTSRMDSVEFGMQDMDRDIRNHERSIYRLER